jgi:hypothetical protein
MADIVGGNQPARGSEIMVVRLRGRRQASQWARRVLPEMVEPAQDPA